MKPYFFILLQLLHFFSLNAQDTFSIVAVDSVTGEVGSAGATCLQAPNPPDGALIISDIIPGLGAAHTQAQWNEFNQINVHGLMLQHLSPQEILAEANISDWDGDSTIRQYGVAMFDANGSPQAGGFTGINCLDYKNHITGNYYSIQGNILIGLQVLDSIESRFLHSGGSLADRLMAALQGANIPGADSRCLSEGVPSKSSFIRVAKSGDNDSTLYLHLVVKSRPYGMSPIDSLQTLFDGWKQNHPSGLEQMQNDELKIYPNPAREVCNLQFTDWKRRKVEVVDLMEKIVYETTTFSNCRLPIAEWAIGIYFIHIANSNYKLLIH